MIDYYYLLLRGFSEKERKETLHVLKDVGMCKFTAAVMYVMKEIFGLPDKYLLLEPNDRIGKILVSEILVAGNFGFMIIVIHLQVNQFIPNIFLEIYRNLHFAIDFPSETVWGRPISRWWHMIYKAYLRRQLRRSSK